MTDLIDKSVDVARSQRGPVCPECGRIFDILMNDDDVAAWFYGHDCGERGYVAPPEGHFSPSGRFLPDYRVTKRNIVALRELLKASQTDYRDQT